MNNIDIKPKLNYNCHDCHNQTDKPTFWEFARDSRFIVCPDCYDYRNHQKHTIARALLNSAHF